MDTDKVADLYDGESYDARGYHFEGELDFWSRKAEESGKDILELCCGTGRLAIPLASKGFNVMGIDLNRSMVDRAKQNAMDADVDIDWIIGDIRDFCISASFDMVFIGLNSMLHLLENEDIDSMLSCVRKHLRPGGRFVTAIFNPSFEILSRNPNDRYSHVIFNHPTTSEKIAIEESVNYDKTTQINHVTLYYKFEDGTEETKPLDIRILYPKEIEYILKQNGFRIENKYGDYLMNEFESESPMDIVSCIRADD